ncbi:4-amino-4-deoxychorismate lyase [Shimia gijangensis]|uniref:Probable branched-chain-amino-acid aminotransferase n=1 Tax=Shimia gijangensis TaxID=1470563 RepID=A0A1M6Q7K4_9RHOB|nr:aminotransferase class IV family protein [Shimia gijangensis]SHK16073.1 4-amino-4-deoxychorismate lyase [Shimia gijangensis]
MESSFRGPIPAGTRLIETFGWSPDDGFARLDRHLARMARSADKLGFDFDATTSRRAIQVSGEAPLRCRLSLGKDGFDFTTAPMEPVTGVWTLCIAADRLVAEDPWLAHKTTQRAIYDRTRAALPDGIDEVIFLNNHDDVCEGTITNLFVTLENGDMLTPPLASGVLPGILREILIENGTAREAVIDLALLRAVKTLHVGNSLRGLIPARLIES